MIWWDGGIIKAKKFKKKQLNKAQWIIQPYLCYYLSEFLCICKIVHSDGQENVQQSVWSQPCSGYDQCWSMYNWETLININWSDTDLWLRRGK